MWGDRRLALWVFRGLVFRVRGPKGQSNIRLEPYLHDLERDVRLS
jgi:hypothetical protein